MKVALSLAIVAGCALTGKPKPIEIHYFAPPLGITPLAPPPEPALRVRLGRVTASDHLSAPIAHRSSPVEVGVYDTRRWTDSPEIYVRRVLERELGWPGGGEHEVTLDVEVLAFEELRVPGPAGRVQLRYRLRDEHGLLASGIITQARDARGTDFAAVVVAIGSALDEAGLELARVAADAYRRQVISRRGARRSSGDR